MWHDGYKKLVIYFKYILLQSIGKVVNTHICIHIKIYFLYIYLYYNFNGG